MSLKRKVRKAAIVAVEYLLVMAVVLGSVGYGLSLIKESLDKEFKSSARIINEIVPEKKIGEQNKVDPLPIFPVNIAP